MKRMLCLMLSFSLLLAGCGIFGERLREPVTYYYLRSDITHGETDGVIAPEQREASGHRQDLSYLMAMYLAGPSEEDLRLPLPRGTRILSLTQVEETLTLELSDTTKNQSDIAFSLACSCLAMTCFELCDAQAVTIVSGERTMTLTRAEILLEDIPITSEEST